MKTTCSCVVPLNFLLLLDMPMCCNPVPMTVKTLSDVSEVTHFKWDPVISWRRMGQRGKEERKKVASFMQMTTKLGT